MSAAASCVFRVQIGVHLYPDERAVNGDIAGKGLQIRSYDKVVPVDLVAVIAVFWLILSQPQLRAASAIGHIYT